MMRISGSEVDEHRRKWHCNAHLIVPSSPNLEGDLGFGVTSANADKGQEGSTARSISTFTSYPSME